MARRSCSMDSGKSLGLALVFFWAFVAAEFFQSGKGAALQADVSPETMPKIQQAEPSQAAAGSEVTVRIAGRNFSGGVYVSFSTPAVHVLSTRRVSPTQIEAKLAISPKAQPGAVSLYVSNPASSVAESSFTIVAGTETAGPAAHKGEIEPSSAGTPEVSSVNPSRVARGSQITLKVTGKNFAQRAKISFSNPGIRVLGVGSAKGTELAAQIVVAKDAPIGKSSLFVVNPDDSEAEVGFEVADSAAPSPSGPQPASTPNTEGGGSAQQQFEVYNLADAASILQNAKKAKGLLKWAGGKLKYVEAGEEVFSAASGDIKEIDLNTILGVNTGTFHVMLNSGKTYNFIAASLRPADSQSLVESLRRVLH